MILGDKIFNELANLLGQPPTTNLGPAKFAGRQEEKPDTGGRR
jgi:hypothetical protein